MKCIPIGISGKMRPKDFMRPSDFSDRQFDGIQLRKAVNGETVLIMRSRKPMPLNRKVTLSFEVDIIECFMAEIRNLPGLPVELRTACGMR